MTHIMLDLETLGTAPGCIIRSIGAVVFDPETGDKGKRFYVNVNRGSCECVGLTADPGTEAWWQKQSAAAREALEKDQRPLREALARFGYFFAGEQGDRLWCHGPSFDEAVLSAAYRAAGMPPPWRYNQARDTRTVYDMAGIEPERSSGVHHDALNDAIVQADAVHRGYLVLGLAKTTMASAQAAG